MRRQIRKKIIGVAIALMMMSSIVWGNMASEVQAAERGTGTGTLYYNAQLSTGTSFTLNQTVYVVPTGDSNAAGLSDPQLASVSLPSCFKGRATMLAQDGSAKDSGGASMSYNGEVSGTIYAITNNQYVSPMDEHNGWFVTTDSGATWNFICTQSTSSKGTFYLYTVEQTSFVAADVTVTQVNLMPYDSQTTVSKSDLTVSVHANDQDYTFDDYTFTV